MLPGTQGPFPGMDPYLEDPALWPDFQRRLVAILAQQLAAALEPRYRVLTGTRRYAASGPREAEAHREDYVEIRNSSDARLVTLLEVVSPANKTTPQGRRLYLEQRHAAQEDQAKLVEIDLVLQGQPTLEYSRDGLPKWNYAVSVTRSAQPERYEIYTAMLSKRLPRFRLPLAADDRDTVVDLQAALEACYAAGDYGAKIDYGRDPAVPLTEEDRAWLDERLRSQGLREPLLSQEDIARVAYHLWEQEGRPHGRDQEHWQEAQEQLRQERRQAGKR